LYGQAAFLLATAIVIALGRVDFGAGQASSSRYQTPAMLFWACLVSLLLLRFERQNRARTVLTLKIAVLMVIVLSGFGAPSIYSANRLRAEKLGNACKAVSAGTFDPALTAPLLDHPDVVSRGGKLLRSIWDSK
jgi:hypothetical protein